MKTSYWRSNRCKKVYVWLCNWNNWILPLYPCFLKKRKGIRLVKNWVVGCWHGYLSCNKCIAVRKLPHRYGNSHAIWDHTVLPATRQRWYSRLAPGTWPRFSVVIHVPSLYPVEPTMSLSPPIFLAISQPHAWIQMAVKRRVCRGDVRYWG